MAAIRTSAGIGRTARGALRDLNRSCSTNRRWLLGPQCSRYSTDDKGRKTNLRDQLQSENHRMDEEPRAFQAQLWDSTYQRIQRERNQKIKYGAMQGFGDSAVNRAGALLLRMSGC